MWWPPSGLHCCRSRLRRDCPVLLTARWGRRTHSAALGRCVQTTAASQMNEACAAHMPTSPLRCSAPTRRPAVTFCAPLVACGEGRGMRRAGHPGLRGILDGSLVGVGGAQGRVAQPPVPDEHRRAVTPKAGPPTLKPGQNPSQTRPALSRKSASPKRQRKQRPKREKAEDPFQDLPPLQTRINQR
jgi:hypothetical protein